MSPTRLSGLVLLALTVVGAGPATSQLQFQQLGKRAIPVHPKDQTYNVALGDVDNDGDLDVALASTRGQSRLYLNDGDGNLTDAPNNVPPGARQTTDIELGDVDGDGDLDMVLGNMRGTGPAQTLLWLNNGAGVFTAAPSSRLPTDSDDTIDVALADIDRDRDIDIVLGNQNGRNRLYLNNGTGTFTDATSRLPGSTSSTYYVAIVDVDGDSDVDLLFANNGQQNRLLIHDFPNRRFVDQTSTRLPIDSRASFGVHAGDVDNDGDQDLLIANYAAPNNLYLNNGSGNFTRSGRLPNRSDKTYRLEPLDVDGDNDLDLVAVNYGNQNRLLVNNGNGPFADLTATRLPRLVDSSIGFDAGDLDGDGDPDLVVGLWNGSNHVLFNHHRHAYAVASATIGRGYALDLYSRPGHGTVPQVALPFLNLLPLRPKVRIPPLGLLGVSPAGIVILPSIPIPAPAGKGTVVIPIPNLPGLRGLTLYAQAVVLQIPVGYRFTNVHADRIR